MAHPVVFVAGRQCGGAYLATPTQRTVGAGLPAGTDSGQQPRRASPTGNGYVQNLWEAA
jgi:hypothetical protein